MPEKDINSLRNERLLYVAVWALIAVLPVVLELWRYANTSVFEWGIVIRWWLSMLPLIVAFLVNNHLLIPRFIMKRKWGSYILVLLLTMVVCVVCQCAVDNAIRRVTMENSLPHDHRHGFNPHRYGPQMPPADSLSFGQPHGHRPPDHRPSLHRPPGHLPPRPFSFIFMLMFTALTIGLNVTVSLIFAYNRQQASRNELDNRRLQEELKYLKQQISPHFLMNVLNNIHEMAEENVKEAQDMILELSYLMRYVLYEGENQTTTLVSECRFISSFIALMKRRYVEGMVQINVRVPEQDSQDVTVPPLLFLPFIENAFKHGVSYTSPTIIDIQLYRLSDRLVFRCENSVPADRDNISEPGVGLNNVKRRLQLLYDRDYSLDIQKDNYTYSVTLIIPVR